MKLKTYEVVLIAVASICLALAIGLTILTAVDDTGLSVQELQQELFKETSAQKQYHMDPGIGRVIVWNGEVEDVSLTPFIAVRNRDAVGYIKIIARDKGVGAWALDGVAIVYARCESFACTFYNVGDRVRVAGAITDVGLSGLSPVVVINEPDIERIY